MSTPRQLFFHVPEMSFSQLLAWLSPSPFMSQPCCHLLKHSSISLTGSFSFPWGPHPMDTHYHSNQCACFIALNTISYFIDFITCLLSVSHSSNVNSIRKMSWLIYTISLMLRTWCALKKDSNKWVKLTWEKSEKNPALSKRNQVKVRFAVIIYLQEKWDLFLPQF